eukprot:gnl/TRDRNA2_/TRDRNA2_200843_c0_seq1.p1 gnl/TRDRNA2_/TRDRNA2_200843_c0~~gnl/TRDRNA2_/TRDRNA2_200843_c0_seq1.p1  ORF type:complete len:195 (+),score=32.83 gnl/TRDRNA2_/TRDRNA2_200843_c0_seq1:57-587(+)
MDGFMGYFMCCGHNRQEIPTKDVKDAPEKWRPQQVETAVTPLIDLPDDPAIHTTEVRERNPSGRLGSPMPRGSQKRSANNSVGEKLNSGSAYFPKKDRSPTPQGGAARSEKGKGRSPRGAKGQEVAERLAQVSSHARSELGRLRENIKHIDLSDDNESTTTPGPEGGNVLRNDGKL